jgi:hypothetical protein
MKFKFLILLFLFSINAFTLDQFTDNRGITYKVGQRVKILNNYGGHKPSGVGVIEDVSGPPGGAGTAKVRFKDGKWALYDFHAIELMGRPGQH